MYPGYFAEEIRPTHTNAHMGEISYRSRIVLRHWKSEEKISVKEQEELTRIASFEQLIYKINNNLDLFSKVWAPYLEMIGK